MYLELGEPSGGRACRSALAMAPCECVLGSANPLRTSRTSKRSRCGTVRILEADHNQCGHAARDLLHGQKRLDGTIVANDFFTIFTHLVAFSRIFAAIFRSWGSRDGLTSDRRRTDGATTRWLRRAETKAYFGQTRPSVFGAPHCHPVLAPRSLRHRSLDGEPDLSQRSWRKQIVWQTRLRWTGLKARESMRTKARMRLEIL